MPLGTRNCRLLVQVVKRAAESRGSERLGLVVGADAERSACSHVVRRRCGSRQTTPAHAAVKGLAAFPAPADTPSRVWSRPRSPSLSCAALSAG